MVDAEYLVDDAFLEEHGISKGHMQLVDETRLRDLLQVLPVGPKARTSGGSVANSVYACRGFGCSTHLVCRVARDVSGVHFKDELSAAGIGCSQFADGADSHSGQCLVLVTPDAERTMNTCLGVSNLLNAEQLSVDVLKTSKYLYIEGYLASSSSGSQTAILAREVAETHDILTSLTLSDTSMIQLYRSTLNSMLGDGIDRLFCNEEEALLWCGTDRIDIALKELLDIARNVHITLGARGCLVNVEHESHTVDAFPACPINFNGAGDIFAGGVLAALNHGATNMEASRFGNYVASMLIQCFGARLPSIDDYQLLAESYVGFKS